MVAMTWHQSYKSWHYHLWINTILSFLKLNTLFINFTTLFLFMYPTLSGLLFAAKLFVIRLYHCFFNLIWWHFICLVGHTCNDGNPLWSIGNYITSSWFAWINIIVFCPCYLLLSLNVMFTALLSTWYLKIAQYGFLGVYTNTVPIYWPFMDK